MSVPDTGTPRPAAFDVAGIRAAWAGMVGVNVARATRPGAIDGDALVVKTDSAEWSHQLAFLEGEIVRRLPREIKRLRYRHPSKTLNAAQVRELIAEVRSWISEPRVKGGCVECAHGAQDYLDQVVPALESALDAVDGVSEVLDGPMPAPYPGTSTKFEDGIARCRADVRAALRGLRGTA